VGGIRHLTEMLERYVDDSSSNLDRLQEVLNAFTRGAGAKRLGFIAEALARDERSGRSKLLGQISDVTSRFLKSGVVRLDPSLQRRGWMSTRWGLWVNTTVGLRDHS
jgi:predicted transcriptional regulator of viral defense system